MRNALAEYLQETMCSHACLLRLIAEAEERHGKMPIP